MEKDFCEEFERSVFSNLCQCLPGLEKTNTVYNACVPVILAAVSGGADSVSLLCALIHIARKYNTFSVEVITVNHNIRSQEESEGDVRFVQNLCTKFEVKCHTVYFERGEVYALAKKRNKGTEEAARFLRYESFERYVQSCGAIALCLGHTQNDQIETFLMRILQGGGFGTLSCIALQRGVYCRPLLDMTRNEVELYIQKRFLSYCTDVTNKSDVYLRSRLRTHLLDVLDITYAGWKTGVLKAIEKARLDDEALDCAASQLQWKRQNDLLIFMSLEEFDAVFPAIQYRLLYAGLRLLKIENRVPYALLQQVVAGQKRVQGSGVDIRRSGNELSMKKTPFLSEFGKTVADMEKNDCCYEIKEPGGLYPFPAKNPIGYITVTDTLIEKKPEGFEMSEVYVQGLFSLPLRIRTGRMHDSVQTSDGRLKLVKKIFSEWHISKEKRQYVPIIEEYVSGSDERGAIRCIWGKPLGFSDWYVKNPRRGECEKTKEKTNMVYVLLYTKVREKDE